MLDWRTVNVLNCETLTLIKWTESMFLSNLSLMRKCKVNTKKLSPFIANVVANYREVSFCCWLTSCLTRKK